MDNVPSSGVPAWRVTGQQESSQPAASGTYTPGLVVSFITGAGNAGTVFVPRNQYTPDNVRAAVSAAAARLDEIGNLTG